MLRILSTLLLLCLSAHAAPWVLPAANQGWWTPGTNVGINGGIDQYRVGGASARTTLVNVKDSPYFAAGNNNETTGAITSGTAELTVVSAAGFSAGNYITYGTKAVSSFEVTTGASVTASAVFYLGTANTTMKFYLPVTAGDTATEVATKLRALTIAQGRIITGGSGTTVTFLHPNNGAVLSSTMDANGTGIAGTWATVATGTSTAARISSVAGNVLTLDGNSPETLTSGLVQHNDAPSINAALTANWGVSGVVIYAPAGTYRLSTAVNIIRFTSNQTIRGDGASTVFHGAIDNGIMVSFQDMGGFPHQSQTITGTKTKGTSVLSVADSSAYSVGDLAQITVENEENNTRILAGAAPTWNTAGFPNMRQVLVKVTAVASGTITIDPPLIWDCTAYATSIAKNDLNYANRKIGFEDMSCTFDAASHPRHFIGTADADECWFCNISAPAWQKNNDAGSVIFLVGAYKSEIRRCDFRTIGQSVTSDDGSIQTGTMSSCLIIDNIGEGFDSGVYCGGKQFNNVFAFNYWDVEANYPGHGGHNSLDLWEGNVSRAIHADGFHGSNSHITIFRNWMDWAIFLKRFSYYFVSAGNVLGKPGGDTDGGVDYGRPNIGNGDYTGTANHFTGDPHADWGITGTLTTRTSDTEGVVTAVGGDFDASTGAQGNGAYSRLISLRWAGGQRIQMSMPSRSGQVLTVSGGSQDVLPAQGTTFTLVSVFSAGYQELDYGVNHTMTRGDNWLVPITGSGTMESPTADVLPNSLTYAAQPAWWDDDGFTGTWPAVNPDSPSYSDSIIPAGFRFTSIAAPDPAPVLTNATIGASGTTITFSFTEAVTPGAGGSTGWALSLSTGSATATYSSGSGTNALIYNLSSTVDNGTTGTVAYTQPTNGLEDGTGNDLATLSGFTITNNSTQGEAPPDPAPTGAAVTVSGDATIGGTLSIGN